MTTQTVYYDDLSERELEILRLLADGLTNQQIADTLHLALTTVKWYNTQIYDKLNVKNRKQAVKRAQSFSLLMADAEKPDIEARLHLPAQTTPFIGREREIAELSGLLQDSGVRLVTILGPGGMGKTRLAIETASRQLMQFPGGVFFISLTPLNTGDGLASAIIQQTGIPIDLENDSAIAQMARYFGDQSLLLVLDNFEHLLSEATLITELLKALPGTKIVITSRERANLAGETVYPLDGLALPDVNQPDDFAQSDAVKLFVQSARRARPDFQLATGDHPALAQVCQLVQGMPLGIELAAGWMDLLTLAQIATEIQRSLDILETELRDVPERHRSVRATFDRTWNGLNVTEASAFMRMAVFRGGFDAEAAQQVAGANLRVLRALVNKALIYARPEGKYELHELLRQYAEDKLRNANALAATHDAHADYFTALAVRCYPGIKDMQPAASIMLDRDYDNIVTAWRWLVQQQDWTRMRQMTDSLCYLVGNYGHNYDGYDLLLETVAAIEDSAPSRLLGYLLISLTEVTIGIYPEISFQYLWRAIDILEADGPSRELAIAYEYVGHYADKSKLSLKDVVAYVNKGIAVARQVNAPLLEVDMQQQMLWHRYEMGEDAAKLRAELEALEKNARDNGAKQSMLWVMGWLYSMLSIKMGDYDEARRRRVYLIEAAERVYDFYSLGGLRGGLCEMELELGNRAAAAQQMHALIRIHAEHARDWQTLGALTGVVKHYLLPAGDYENSVKLLTFIMHYPRTAPNHRTEARSDHLLGKVRAALSEMASEDELTNWQSYSLMQVCNMVLDLLADHAREAENREKSS